MTPEEKKLSDRLHKQSLEKIRELEREIAQLKRRLEAVERDYEVDHGRLVVVEPMPIVAVPFRVIY